MSLEQLNKKAHGLLKNMKKYTFIEMPYPRREGKERVQVFVKLKDIPLFRFVISKDEFIMEFKGKYNLNDLTLEQFDELLSKLEDHTRAGLTYHSFHTSERYQEKKKAKLEVLKTIDRMGIKWIA